MARIIIKDLHEKHEVSKEEMRKVFGGVEPTTFPVISDPFLFGSGISLQPRIKNSQLGVLPKIGGRLI